MAHSVDTQGPRSPFLEICLSLVTATSALLYPVLSRDSRIPILLLYFTYITSLLMIAAYGYISFSSYKDPRLATITAVLSAMGCSVIFSTSADGSESVLTFLPLVLSLSTYLVANLPGMWISVWTDVVKRWLDAIGAFLERIGQRLRGHSGATLHDVEQARPASTISHGGDSRQNPVFHNGGTQTISMTVEVNASDSMQIAKILFAFFLLF